MSRAALLASAAAAVILFAIPAGKPLHLDDMDFPAVAKAASETGLPIYYRGEENPHHSGLYHPPLYIYALAGWFRLWGFGEAQARLFGLACLFLYGWIVWLGVRTLWGGETARRAAPWFCAFFLLNPFALQGAAVLDIDTSVYGPLLTGLVVWTLRLSWRDGQTREEEPAGWEYAALGLLTAAAFWAKLTTVLSVIPAVIALAGLQFGWRKAFWRVTGAMAAGAGLFLGSYAMYGWLTGQDTGYTFRFVAASVAQRTSPGSWMERLSAHWRVLLDMCLWQVKWSGLLPWIAGAAAMPALVWRGWRKNRKQWQAAAVALGWALAVTAIYCGLTYTYGRAPFKYVFVAWGIVAANAALWTSAAWERVKQASGAARLWAAGAGVLLFSAFFAISARWLRDQMILEGRLARADLAALVLPAAGAIAGLALWQNRGAWAHVAAAAAHLGWALGLALCMARAPYPTTYDYGQQGFEETVCFLTQHTRPDEAIVSMKDVGFRAGRRYWENYGFVYGGPERAELLRQLLKQGKARYAVFTEGIGADALNFSLRLKEVIEEACRLERSYGHYRIYDCRRQEPEARREGGTDTGGGSGGRGR